MRVFGKVGKGDGLPTTAKCAARLGPAVRSRRVHELQNRIAPKGAVKAWRLNGAPEILRLHDIPALKQSGVSLPFG